MISKKKNVATKKAELKAQPRRMKVNTDKFEQSQALLRANESLLRSIAENYPNSYISIIEKDLTIGYTAGQEFKNQNLNPNQFVGLTLEQVFGKHTPLVRENYLQTFEGVETQFEIFINNQYQFYRTVPLKDQAGRITRILVVVENVTERKLAEAALRISEERYRYFFTQSFEAISRTEFDHPIDITLPVEEQIDCIYENAFMAECNQAMADMYHVPSPEVFIGMRLIDAHGGKDDPINRETFRKLIVNGYKSINDETKEYTVDGKPIWFLSNTIGIVENGYLIRLWGTAIDITERKQMEAALRASEASIRSLIENVNDVFVRYDLNLRYQYVSPLIQNFLNLTPENLIGKTHREAGFPEDKADFFDASLRKVIETKTPIDVEFSDQGRDGEIIMQTRIYPEIDEKGEVVSVVTVTSDITERKRADERLRESESLYEALVNQLPQSLYRIALDGKVLFVNKTLQQNLGAPLEDILGKIAYDLYPEDKALQYREEDAQVIASGIPLMLIDENISPVTGQISYNEGIKIPFFDKDGNVRGIQGIFYDITERKLADEKLRESEKRFRQLIFSAPDVVFLFDQEGKIVFANMEATNLLGYAPDEFIGMAVEKLLPQDLREEHTINRARYMGNPRTRLMGIRKNLVTAHKDGSKIPVDIKLSPVKMDTGTYVIAFMRDITEHKRAEEKLREQGVLLSQSQEIAHIGSWKLNLIANHLTWSDEVYRIFGCEPQAFAATYEAFLDFIHPDDRDMVNEAYSHSLQVGANGYEIEHRIIRSDTGELRYVHERCFHERDDTGTIVQSIGMVQDITDRKRAEEELIKAKETAEESETLFSKSLEFSTTPIALAEISGKLIFLNKNFTDTYGYTLQDIPTIDQWMHKAYPDPEYRNSLSQIWGQDSEYAIKNNTNTPLRECQVTCKSGDVKTVEVTSYFQKQLFIGHFQDVSERKRAENDLRDTHKTLQMQFSEINILKEILQEQAIRDPLTGLHNRRYLDETLAHEVARAKRENYPIGVMLIDIDHFKKFNDTYGHAAGDEVVKALSRLLLESVRQGDIACRYGGEEFLVVMIGAHEKDVERRAETICRDFSRLQIHFEGQELSATISLGTALHPKHGVDIQQVIRAADTAMYQAKEAGRNRVQAWAGG